MKRMILFIVAMVSLLLYSGLTVAQTNIWEKNMGSHIAISFSILTNDNNSVTISGRPDNFSSSQLIINFDNQGDQLWQKDLCYSFSMSNYGNNIMTIDSGQAVILLDGAGNIVKKIIMPDIIASNDYICYICQDKNSGNYYMVSTNKNFSFTGWTVFVYDSNLDFVRSFPVTDNSFGYVQSVFVQNGDIYLARWRYGTGNYSNIISDVYKYDSLGNLQWTKALLDRHHPHLTSSNGEIYCGATNLWRDSDHLSWELIKLDTNSGNTIWSKNWLGHIANTQDVLWVNGVLGLPNGGCLVFGSTNKTGLHDVYNPLVIGYSAQGDSLFSIESTESNSTGEFDLGTWDNNHALILSGSIDGTSKIWKYSLPGITAVKTESSEIPANYSLFQNYPNPFNPSTAINFSVPQSGQVTLKVYNLLGCEVATLVNEELRVGNYSAKFEAKQLASGIYIYRLTAKNFTSSKKMMLVK